MSSEYEYPVFVEHMTGKCDLCGEENVGLCIIPGYMNLCRSCVENELTLCDECGEVYVDGSIEFTYTKDGRCICEYCMEDIEEESDDEEYE